MEKRKTDNPYESEYRSPDKYFYANDEDTDLTPFKVPIPPCPEWHTIEGYGLPAKEQKFRRPKMPKRFRELEKMKDPATGEDFDLRSIAEYLKSHRREYAKELQFADREWQRRENGFWFFNNGKPTYITGTHYLYVAWWHIDVGPPKYRDRDRRFFMTLKFCEDDDRCMGMVYPKHRREGATHKAACWEYDYVSSHHNSFGGCQSATEGHAKEVFQLHLVPGWKKLPFFFKPKYEGTNNPKTELSFNEPGKRITASNMSMFNELYLESKCNFKSSDVKGYDSRKLHRYHGDEVGKTTEIDVKDRHDTIMECLVETDTIIGKCLYTSTVEEMDKGGGANFKRICDQSHYDHPDKKYQRNLNGMTLSGLYICFIPAFDGYLVDQYGNSRIEESKQRLQNKRDALLEAEDYIGLSKEIRKYPMRYRECWRGDASQCKFNLGILEEQLDKFKFGNDKIEVGNFVWKDGIPDTKVEFMPTPAGRWKVSFLFDDDAREANRFITDHLGNRVPQNIDRFVLGADPFKFKKTISNNRSDGGGAVYMKRDVDIDPDTRPIREWETARFIATYLYRPPTPDEYCEDMLLASIYYGCETATESNIADVANHFDRRGYGGYLFYEIDRKTGKFKDTAGFYAGKDNIEDIYKCTQKQIELHGYREVHDDWLEQCKDVEDDMGDFDLFAAAGWALKAAKRTIDLRSGGDSGEVTAYVRQYEIKSSRP